MKKFLPLFVFLLVAGMSRSQNVGIGTTTPDASAQLDISSTTSGLLAPRMTKAQRDAIATPATGLLIYQTNNTAGFYYYDGSTWKMINSGGKAWLLLPLLKMTRRIVFLPPIASMRRDSFG